jgi:DNA-binding transcriptional LysR family regulator
VTIASPACLEHVGRPRSWDDLEDRRMVGFHSSATGAVLPLEFMVEGSRKTVTLLMSLTVNGADSYRVAALAGLGLVQLPTYAVGLDLETGALIECLANTPPSPTPVFVLYPRTRQLSLRVRVFIDRPAGEYARQGES